MAAVPSQNPHGSLPVAWTTLPEFGILIEDNVVQNALGGIQIGTGQWVNYWNGQVSSPPSNGRVYLTAAVIGNIIEYTSAYLSDDVDPEYSADWYNSPYDYGATANELPPTITIGSGWSPIAPGSQNPPRIPSTVGNYLGANGGDTLVFVDPTENVVDVEGNEAVTLNTNGTTTQIPEPTGQVYDGIVNGATVAGPLKPEYNQNSNNQYYNTQYFPFNVNNTALGSGNPDSANELNITASPTTTQGIQALIVGQDNNDLVGTGSGTPEPDGTQDLHIELVGLSPDDTITGLVITDAADNESWQWPESGSSLQIMFDHPAGTTTGDIFIEPTGWHIDDDFTISLTYAAASPISIPVQGVMFSPALSVAQTVAPAPLKLAVTATTTTSVSLSWARRRGRPITPSIMSRPACRIPGRPPLRVRSPVRPIPSAA